jgi:hypothetical protein
VNNLVYQQIDDLLANSAERKRLTSQNALRVGAATLLNGPPGEITATTVVCDLGADDELDPFDCLVADLAKEYGLVAAIQQNSGSCSVRFTRPTPAPAPEGRSRTVKSVLARLFAPPVDPQERA